jgi:hypothetical protein
VRPCSQIEKLLSPACCCPDMKGRCQQHIVNAPVAGYMPRGYGGATIDCPSVRLVVVTAEPGTPPLPFEKYTGPTGAEKFAQHAAVMTQVLAKPQGRFHLNLRLILDLCWGNIGLDKQMERTWLTNTVLCSALVNGGEFPPIVETVCGQNWLLPQLALFEKKFVLALGGKANRRLTASGFTPNVIAHHPTARDPRAATATWSAAAYDFQNWLLLNP